MDQKQLKRVFFDAVKQRATQANPRVTHAKLLFDPTRPDANGKPRSRGIGFVELPSTSTRWRRCARSTTTPPRPLPQRRPIVEFAVEDARAVRKLERRREGLDKAQRERDTEREARGEAARDEADGAKKKTRGQKRREREREGDAGAAKKPWGNKKRSLSGAGDAAASDGARGGDTKALRDGGRAGARRRRRRSRRRSAGSRLSFPSGSQASREAPKKRPRDGDAAPARVAGRGLERRDATDDLVDRHVARARAGDARRETARRSGDGSTTDARRGTVRSYRDAPEDAEDASARAPAYNRRIYVFIRIYYVRVRLIRLRVRFRARQTCRCFSDPVILH